MARALILALATILACASTADASWRLTRNGAVYAKGRTLAGAVTPTVASAGNGTLRVNLSWTASSFSAGGTVPAHLVKRYSAATGIVSVIGGTCTGLVTALSCSDTSVPKGDWRYSITPAAGNWRGTESAKSATVTVK